MASAWTAPFRWLYGWIDRAVCVGMALLLAQLPVFTDQYMDVLIQARQGTDVMYHSTTRTAAQLNLTPEDYLADLQARATSKERDSLALVNGAIQRHEYYQRTYETLKEQPAWLRPLVLPKHLDANVRKTMHFSPSLLWSWEGLGYGLLGMTLGWLLMGIPRRLFRRRPASA